jgi:hypothetical protein
MRDFAAPGNGNELSQIGIILALHKTQSDGDEAMTDREEKIRERAHHIWEEEGRPEGRAADHWHRAAREVEPQPGNGSAAPPKAESVGLPKFEPIPVISTSAPSLQTADAPAEGPAPRRGKATGGAPTPRKRTPTKR